MNIFMVLAIFGFIAKSVLKKENPFCRSTLNLLILCFFLITCISAVNSAYFNDTLKGGIVRLLRFILIFFIVATQVKDKKHAKAIIFSIALGLCLLAIDEIYQVASGKDFIRGFSPVLNLGIVRATASFKDSNTLGVYLSAFTPIILGMAFFYPRGWGKTIFILVGFLASAGIILTYSRPTLLALYAAFWFFAIIKKRRPLIFLLIILTLLSPFVLPKQVKEWAKYVQYHPVRFMCNDDRIAIYFNSLNMIRSHPVIGLGANTYMKNYRFYKNSPEYRNIITSDYIYAHNNFLHMAAEVGLLGLGIFIWLLYCLFKKSALIYQSLRAGFFKDLSFALIVSLGSFLINGLTESSLYSARVAGIFWFLGGFSLSLAKFINADK
ncbi:MAG: O-antigen ligase family protein [Candidatus Omnitrophota bacterium]